MPSSVSPKENDVRLDPSYTGAPTPPGLPCASPFGTRSRRTGSHSAWVGPHFRVVLMLAEFRAPRRSGQG